MDELSVQDLSDEQLNELIAMGVIPEQQAALAKQIEQARMMQQMQSPQMRSSGRVSTAANPLEFIGAGLQQYAGMRREKDLMKKMDDLQKQQIQGRQMFMQRLVDTPYRRSTQPFMQPVQVDPNNVPAPAMRY